MMIRGAVVMSTLIFGVGAVLAQSDTVTIRENLMKQNQEHANVLFKMVKGEAPYDAAKVRAAFDQWANTAHQLPNLFPDTAKSGGDNKARPEIWKNKADFSAKIAAFAEAVADNKDRAAKDLDGLKTAFNAVGKGCGDCHERYRVPER